MSVPLLQNACFFANAPNPQERRSRMVGKEERKKERRKEAVPKKNREVEDSYAVYYLPGIYYTIGGGVSVTAQLSYVPVAQLRSVEPRLH